MKVGPFEWMSSDDYFRPSLWIALPHSRIVIFFGWQWPPFLLWLRTRRETRTMDDDQTRIGDLDADPAPQHAPTDMKG